MSASYSFSARILSMSIIVPVDFQRHSVNICQYIQIKLRGGAPDLRVPGAEGR